MAKYVLYTAFRGVIVSRNNYTNRNKFINTIIYSIAITPNLLGSITIGDTHLSTYELIKWLSKPLMDITKKDLNQLCIDILKGAE